jgi:hypothetical protein
MTSLYLFPENCRLILKGRLAEVRLCGLILRQPVKQWGAGEANDESALY